MPPQTSHIAHRLNKLPHGTHTHPVYYDMPPILFFGETAYAIQRDFFRLGPRSQFFLTQTQNTVTWCFQFMDLGMEHRIGRSHYLTTTSDRIMGQGGMPHAAINPYDFITMDIEEEEEEEANDQWPPIMLSPPNSPPTSSTSVVFSEPSTPPPDGPGLDPAARVTHIDGVPVVSNQHALRLIFGNVYWRYLTELYAEHGIQILSDNNNEEE